MEKYLSNLSKDELILFFKRNPVPMFIFSEVDYKILAVNDSALEKYNYTREEFYKLTIPQLSDLDNRDEVISILSSRIDTLKHIIKQRKKNGTSIIVELITSEFNLHDDHTRIAALNDVTIQFESEKKIDVQYKITKILAESSTIKQASDTILPIICHAENWYMGEIWYEDENKEFLKLVSYWYHPAVYSNELIDYSKSIKHVKGSGIIGKVWFDGCPNYITDIKSTHFIRSDYFKNYAFKSAFIFPIIANHETVGVMVFFSAYNSAPAKSLLLMLETYGKQLGDFALRCKDAELLIRNELRLKGIIESAMDAIITIDNNFNILVFNEAAVKMFGYLLDEVLGKSINILLPLNKRALHTKHIEDFGKLEVANKIVGTPSVAYGQRKNGELFPIEASISQIDIGTEKLYTVILRDVTERMKAEKQLEANLKEKEILLKEIHHRVKNNLQIISSLLSLQSNYIKEKEVANIFNESRHRVKAMALIHEKLYSSNLLSNVNFKDYANDLLFYLLDSYEYSAANISLSVDIEDSIIPLDSVISVGLILNELMSNSLKYAFPNNMHGEIIVKFNKLNENLFKLFFKDNGIGTNKAFNSETSSTLGMLLVHNLAAQLKGNLKITTALNQGFQVDLSIPV